MARAVLFSAWALIFLVSGIGNALGWMDPLEEEIEYYALFSISFGSLMIPIARAEIFRLRMERKPIIELHTEGVVIRLVGHSALSEVPNFAPLSYIKTAFAILSKDAFRTREYHVDWGAIDELRVKKGFKSYLILAGQMAIRRRPGATAPPTRECLQLPAGLFDTHLDRICRNIHFFLRNSTARSSLKSWRPPAKNVDEAQSDPFGPDNNLR